MKSKKKLVNNKLDNFTIQSNYDFIYKFDTFIESFLKIFEDYKFLDQPDPETHKKILSYYTTELNVDIKRKLFCIVSSIMSTEIHK